MNHAGTPAEHRAGAPATRDCFAATDCDRFVYGRCFAKGCVGFHRGAVLRYQIDATVIERRVGQGDPDRVSPMLATKINYRPEY